MKVFVIDDEQVILNSCRLVLVAEGFDASLFDSADKALQALQHEAPALVMVDVKMPGHDGFYFMNEVRKMHGTIPVIVMSGYPTPEIIADSGASGATRFLEKPFTPDEFLDAIYKALGKEKKNETQESTDH